MIEELISRWGYLGVAVGTFFEGETVLVVGGTLAHKGLMSLSGVALSAFMGSLLGDQLWFLIGRRFGVRMLATRPRWRAQTERAGRLASRWGDVFVVGFRFVWGLRNVSPLVLAVSGYSWRRFAVLNTVGAALWAAAISSLGWITGAGVVKVLGRAARLEEIGVALVVVVVGTLALRRHFRARRSQV